MGLYVFCWAVCCVVLLLSTCFKAYLFQGEDVFCLFCLLSSGNSWEMDRNLEHVLLGEKRKEKKKDLTHCYYYYCTFKLALWLQNGAKCQQTWSQMSDELKQSPWVSELRAPPHHTATSLQIWILVGVFNPSCTRRWSNSVICLHPFSSVALNHLIRTDVNSRLLRVCCTPPPTLLSATMRVLSSVNNC